MGGAAAGHRRVAPEALLGFPLPERRPAGVDPAQAGRVCEAMSAALLDWDLLAPHVVFDARGYVRQRLFRNDAWELLLLCWLPGQGTVVHDHGGAWGAVRILVGALHERRYAWHGEGRPLALLLDRDCDPAAVVPEPLDTVHRNVNRAGTPALSLHLYSPPLRVLHAYDEATGARRAVTLPLGSSSAVGGNPRLKPGARRG